MTSCHCRRNCYWLLRYPRKLVTLNPKLKSTGAGRYQLLSRWWDAYRKQLGLKDSPVRTLWRRSRLRSVALYLWLIVVISVRQSTVTLISGLHCRALVMVSSNAGWQPDCKIQRSGRNGQRDWCMSRVTAIISLWLSASSSAYVEAIIITVITPLPASWPRQNARELKLANAAITDMQMRQRDVAALDAKYTGVSWC